MEPRPDRAGSGAVMVSVERSRLERLLALCEAAVDWLNAPVDSDEEMQAMTAIYQAEKALHPSDRDVPEGEPS